MKHLKHINNRAEQQSPCGKTAAGDFFCKNPLSIRDFEPKISFNKTIIKIRIMKKNKEQIKQTRPLTNLERVYLKGLHGIFRKEAFRLFMNNVDFESVSRHICNLQQKQKIKDMRRPAVETMINTVLELQKNKFPIPEEYYKVALDIDFADDYELFGKQALIMLQSYNPDGSGVEYRKLKTFMYDTIHRCFARNIVPHPLMFQFILEGGWISEMSFVLLHRHIAQIEERGLNGMLLSPLRKMLKARKNAVNPTPPFTQAEENYFLSLLALLSRRQKK